MGKWLAGAPLPTGQGDRLQVGPDEFFVDSTEIAQFSSHRRQVDWRLIVVMYRVCSNEEGQHRVLGHTGPVLVYKVGVGVGLQGKWNTAAGPHSWRTCMGEI